AFRPSGAARWLTPEPPGRRASTRRALEYRRCSIKEVMSFLWAIVWRYRWRTLGTILLLVIAKIAAVLVPLALKAIVDHFSATKGGGESGVSISSDLIELPVFLLLGYALLRFASTLFTELRDMVFARVILQAASSFVDRTFEHLLVLGPRF